MARDLAAVVKATGRFLIEEHGFAVSKRRYTRLDELLRSVWFVPLFATKELYRFDVLFDLGIPGISRFSPREQEWIVRAHAQQVSLWEPTYPRVKFVTPPIGGGLVDPAVDEVVQRLAVEFLLRYRTPTELYTLVRNDALAFAVHGMGVDNEFKRLKLDPWNAIVRLELAAVYAAFLGFKDDLVAILAQARDTAERDRVGYAIPRIEAGVESAMRAREPGNASK
jgi:hypothetical protein